jgi:ketosteroid isomerase-like protein
VASAWAQAAPPTDDARCQVWARELGFAASVAGHDAAAFAEHLHPRAAFGVSRKPTLGREAIAAEWQGIVDGSAVELQWYPDLVVPGGDGLVHSTGPALYRDPKTGDYRHSRFNSVWQRDSDGAWRVVFDDGTSPQPAAAAAVEAFRAGRRQACSAG